MADMSSLAHPYAEALFAVAKAQNNIDNWLENLSELSQVASTRAFMELIDNPKFSPDDIVSTFAGFVNKPNKLLNNFLETLQANGRLVVIGDVYRLFEKMSEDERNTSKAVIQSAYPMSDSDKTDFERLLSKKYGRTILASVEVHPELIGGIKVLINDMVIDASVKSSLHKMAAQIIQ
jgi:F-type H+-transporting ATPase subunit delta